MVQIRAPELERFRSYKQKRKMSFNGPDSPLFSQSRIIYCALLNIGQMCKALLNFGVKFCCAGTILAWEADGFFSNISLLLASFLFNKLSFLQNIFFDSSKRRSVIIVYFRNFGTRCTFSVCRILES